ncbi:MAG: SRPBCC domain-containing protein [Opitutae bacterium]|nr:SRPBCC domain-containing protein [Opitutae bacterium]
MAAAPGEFVISRVCPAPRARVWQAWTDPEHLRRWGPSGVTLSHARMDFRPGGNLHCCMTPADGSATWGQWAIREIDAPRRLVFVHSFSDEAGGLTRHPGNASWPREILSTVTFAAASDQTLVTIRWLPLNATAEERRTFAESRNAMNDGWSGSLDQLTACLAG